MIKGDYDKLNEIAKNNVCAEHKTPLEVAWFSPEKIYALRCGSDHFPDVVTRQLSLTELEKVGELPPGPIQDNVKKGMRRRAMTQPKQSTAITMGGVPAADLGSGELLQVDIVKALVEYAKKYGLDAARGHVCLYFGKPYITIDGYLYHANRSKIPYSLESAPLKQELRPYYQINEYDHAWLANVLFTSTGAKFIGLGIVTQQELSEKSKRHPEQLASPVVARHPQLLAQKRAEWQVLRRAFPIGESEEEAIEARDESSLP